MQGTVADPNPKTLENAKRQFVELYGSALVLNTYLKIALVLVSLVALGLLALNFHTAARYAHVKPLVIRIDDVGRAEAVQYDATAYQPQAPELRYFLTQFVVKHFSRLRATVQRDYPESLFFLDSCTGRRHHRAERAEPSHRIVRDEPFGRRGRCRRSERQSERTDQPPYKASVSFQKVLYAPGTRQRARAPDLHCPDRLRASRPRAERVRPRQSARAAGHLLPRGPGVRGGSPMIANSRVPRRPHHLRARCVAGCRVELSRAVQGRDLPRLMESTWRGRRGARVRQPLWARTTSSPDGCSCAMPAES